MWTTLKKRCPHCPQPQQMQCQPGTHIDQGTAPGLTSYLRPHHPHPPSPATHRFFRGGFFFIFSTAPLALHLDRLLPEQNALKVEKSLFAAGIIAACALPLIYIQIDPAIGLPEMLSEQDIFYLQTNFTHARLLNHWNYGGILIFRKRGAIPVFVDGRAATAYPDALFRDYFKLSQLDIDETA